MHAAAYRSASAARLSFLILSSEISSFRNLRASFALSVIQCSTCALAAATLGWLQAMRFITFSSGLRTSGCAWRAFSSNRDFQMSKLFVDVDELETNLSTEFIYEDPR
jgi:hypothetical protein